MKNDLGQWLENIEKQGGMSHWRTWYFSDGGI